MPGSRPPQDPRLPPEWRSLGFPRRFLRPSTVDTPRARILTVLMVGLMICAGIGLSWAIGNGRFWAVLPILGLPSLGIYFVLRQLKKEFLREQHIEADRFEELERQGYTGDVPFEVRARWPVGWLVLLTIVFSLPAVAGAWTRDPLFLAMTVVLGLPGLAITWFVAWRHSRKVLATLDKQGVRIGDLRIPWSNVADMDLRHAYKDRRLLELGLREPLPADGVRKRIDSWLSRGDSDRRVEIPVDRARETPSVIFEIARELWSGKVGSAKANAAIMASLKQRMFAQRPLSQRPVAERRRAYVATAVLCAFGILAFHGMQTDFNCSTPWLRASPWIAVLGTVGGMWWLLKGRGLTVSRRESTLHYLAMMAVVVAFLAAFTWIVIGRSLPDLATRILGSAREVTVAFDKAPRDRYCETRLDLVFEKGGWSTRICTAREFFDALPPAGDVVVIGRQSWFGTHIDDLKTVDPAWHR